MRGSRILIFFRGGEGADIGVCRKEGEKALIKNKFTLIVMTSTLLGKNGTPNSISAHA